MESLQPEHPTGHLLSCTPTPPSKKRMPIILYNGLSDKVMRWPWVRKTFERCISIYLSISLSLSLSLYIYIYIYVVTHNYTRFKEAGYDNVKIHREAGVTHDTGPKEREWLLDFLSRYVKDREG